MAQRRKQADCGRLQERKVADLKELGRLAPSAASIAMTSLYGARFVRVDVLRIVGLLATAFTRWTPECDKRLHRLVSYLDATVEAMQIGWIADDLTQMQPYLYADADFAGCVLTQRSTTGGVLLYPWSSVLLAYSWD